MEKVRNLTLKVKCGVCGNCFELKVNSDDFIEFKSGEKLAQRAFPYLSSEERELLISRTCGKCWNEIFKDCE